MYRQVFVGPMIHANEKREVIFKDNVGIFVENGKIIDVTENPDEEKIHKFKPNKVSNLSQGQFIIPGFIDCHTYALQFTNLGLGYDKTFLNWLETYTFPLEKQFKSVLISILVYNIIVQKTIQSGTTTACYFASLYDTTSMILAFSCAFLGQRTFIGKINMNAPRDDGYYESTEMSVLNTKKFVEFIEQLTTNESNPLVKPIITPRFALSCDMELMQQLAAFAKEKHLPIQSTISQSKDEIQAVKEKFGKATYADVYNAAGLLTDKTTLAHGVYLEDSELDMLANAGTAIIHCPSSNLNLKSGLCDVQRIMAHNIDVGIGTDIAGGSNYSMLDEMRAVLNTSVVLSLTRNNYTPLDYKDVFYMATLGGAKALSIQDEVGNFVPGKEFDALIVDMSSSTTVLDNLVKHTLEEKLQSFIYSGTSDNIKLVYVKGKNVN